MSLKNRLDALRRQSGAAADDTKTSAGSTASIDERLARLGGRARTAAGARPAPSAAALAEALDGEVVAEHVVYRRQTLPAGARHGDWPFAAWRSGGTLLPALDGRVLYLDTETTGLAGGTGTAVFMVGLAVVEGDQVHVHQWTLAAFAGEAALLDAVAQKLASADMVVTYNGKTFDWPLLQTRRRLQRGEALTEPVHVDLLHPVRRLFAAVWPNCRLATVENRLLGVRRHNDLPGSLAPEAWRCWLAGHGGEGMREVARHNAGDLLSLIVLPPALERSFADPHALGADPLAVARVHLQRDAPERALSLLKAECAQLDADGQRLLADAARRAGHWPDALACWERLARGGCAESLERLAKYYEHVVRDWRRALAFAERLPDSEPVWRRRERLRRRLGNQ